MREVFSQIGSRIWCDAHSLGVLLICAALIGRRVFLFTAAVVGAARLLGRGDTQTEPVPSAAIVAPVPAVRSSPEGTFEPPRGFDLPAIPDVSDVRAALERAVVGQSAAIEALMIGLIAGGHVVLEGAPGLGKTCMQHDGARGRRNARAHSVSCRSYSGRRRRL